MLYRALLVIGRVAVAIFHRRVDVEHVERVPARGPVVFAANHPNMMLDVLLLATTQPRKLHFLAKSTLFRNPLLGFALARAGTLPVYRRRESQSPEELTKNVGTFEACHRLLAAGGAIAIFPEGVSHAETRVLPLKTGCARIVLEAEASKSFALGTRILPVGLTFSHRELFRADAHVIFGEPLDPAPYFETYSEGDPARAVRDLTSEVERRLAGLTEHLPNDEDAPVVDTLRRFFPDTAETARSSLSARLDADRHLIEAIDDFRERRPVDYRRLRRQLLAYREVLALARLEDEDVGRDYRLWPVLRYLAPRTILAIAGFLPFAAGLATHYLPYKIPGGLADRPGRHPVERASLKLLLGALLFPAFYVAEALAVGRWLGRDRAAIFLMGLPFLGLFTLFYAETLSDFLREIRIFFQRDRRGRLERWRLSLASELARHRAEYESRNL